MPSHPVLSRPGGVLVAAIVALSAAEVMAAEPTAEAATEPTERREDPRAWRHGGFVVDLQLGGTGCVRQFCAGKPGHDAAPGVHLGAFVGGNVGGLLELGLEVGWNTLRPRGVYGDNAMTLYGIDPKRVGEAIAEYTGASPEAIDFSTLDVTTARSRAFDVGPSIKIHFIRKGRGLAYFGTGAHYQRWRNAYTTKGGDLRLDFHGVSVPLKLGGGVHLHRNIALVGEFTYTLAFFAVGQVRHASFSGAAPLAAIEAQAASVGTDLSAGLPHFWTLSANLRFRF